MITHITLVLPQFRRGFHIITEHIERACTESLGLLPQNGMLHVFIQHSSASLTINENADPSVRVDLEAYTNKLAPEREPYFIHTYEGDDDMPAHIKASLYGSSVTIPIMNGRLALGTWQGIYLGEHRDHGGSRNLVISVVSKICIKLINLISS